MRCGRRPRVSWGFPHIWPDRRRFPFPEEFIPPALSPRLPEEWASNLRRNALSGLQNGRRGPSRSFSVEGGAGIAENPVKSPI